VEEDQERLKTQNGELGPFNHCRWHWSVVPVPDRRHNMCSNVSTSRQVTAVSIEGKPWVWTRVELLPAGADLGGSSKYSNENF